MYESLIHTSDDHKDAVTAQVGIWHDGEKHRRPSTRRSGTTTRATAQMTPRSRSACGSSEDVYLVLTGYDLDRASSRTSACYHQPADLLGVDRLPRCSRSARSSVSSRSALVDKLQCKPKTRLGRAADVGLMLAIVVGVVLGLASPGARARRTRPARRARPAGMGMGARRWWLRGAEPARRTTPPSKAMKELMCPCGCARAEHLRLRLRDRRGSARAR